VADDAKINRDVVFSQLEYLGYPHVVCVGDGTDVLQAIAEMEYDIILLDCMMPKVNGYQTTEIIRQQFSRSPTYPVVIAMTANALPEDQEKCFQAGMNDYLLKPISLKTLQQTLNRWGQIIQQADIPRQIPQESHTEQLQPSLTMIDLERLSRLIPDDLAWTKEFLKEYREASGQYLQQLQFYLEEQNAQKLEYYAHQLKGISRMAAVNIVPQLADNIEQWVIASDFEAIASALEKLALHLGQVHDEIRNVLSNNVLGK
jgi:CheY-like chemotaxis protein/HPt (histidine-containing phosphotransfer) domain-containing protein